MSRTTQNQPEDALSSPHHFMAQALEQAERAFERGEVPVGAVLTVDNVIVATAGNRVEELQDVTAHAEILCLRQAAQKSGSKILSTASLYVTLEPCAICAGAISAARIQRLYYGALDPKSGGVEHGAKLFSHPTCHHRPEIYGGFLESQCGALLSRFFAERRASSLK